MHMRMHLNLDDELAREIDAVAGSRGRSAFIRDALAREMDRRRRWAAFDRAVGAAPDFGAHLPDDWIHKERHADPRRVG
jgi:predicted transcriptional regulator